MEPAIDEAGVGISPDRVVISSGRNGLPPLYAPCQVIDLLPHRRAPAAALVLDPAARASRLPRLVLLVQPAMDKGPDQGAGRDTASVASAAQARVDAFFEAHRQRLSQGSHLRPQPYTSRPPPATDRSAMVL